MWICGAACLPDGGDLGILVAMNTLTRGMVAEFMGTFLFVFFGCASIIMTQKDLGANGSLVTIALAHGLTLGVMITACMYVSGGQLNPAVSIGLVVAGKQKPVQAVAFIVAQLLAASCAAGMLQLILSPDVANHQSVKLGATIGTLTNHVNTQGVFLVEAIATFALMVSVLMSTVDARAHKLGGLVIGLTLAAAIMAIGPLTGASLNPARTFGPAICGSHWDMHWVYWAGPVFGASAAAFVYKVVWDSKPST